VIPDDNFTLTAKRSIQAEGSGEGLTMEVFFGANFEQPQAEQTRVVKDVEFEKAIVSYAREKYLADKNYPSAFEPSGEDFFSPCLNEADLMRRVLGPEISLAYSQPQLAGGVRALTAPVDSLLSNWAYMVMASLAWTLKAWTALLLPVQKRWQAKHQEEQRGLLRMEFKTFINAVVKVPCQIVKQSRRIIFRVLHWNPHLSTFFRLCDRLRC
jgi:hypothetical protein